MKQLINSKLVVVIIFILTIAACYKDKGNYTYSNIDEVTIDTAGIGATRSLKRFDTILIEPVVKYKGEIVNNVHPQFPELQFSWSMYPDVNARVNDLRILDSTVRLFKMLDQPELSWNVRLTVTNKITSVKAFAIFVVKIEPALAEGWLVLYERNGNSDVGMIVNDRINKTVVKEKVVYDIYTASNGQPIKGKPGRISYSLAAIPAVNMYVQTDGDVVSVDANFKKKAGINDSLFWTRPAVIAPQYFQSTDGRRELLMNNNKVHKIDYTQIVTGRQAFDGGALNSFGTLAPWGATAVQGAIATVVYDQTNQRFLKQITTGSELIPFSTVQDAGAAFDVNKVGMQLLMSDIGRNNEEQMVMKETITGKYYLLTANFKLGENTKIGTGKYDMSSCPEIGTINTVTAGSLGEIFFYSGGSNKVYQFKYTGGTTSTVWTAPGNEKVTCIKVQKSYNTNPPANGPLDPKNASKVLYIATYDDATSIGKLYEMDFDPSSGVISTIGQRSYSGFGKIKSMSWKPYL